MFLKVITRIIWLVLLFPLGIGVAYPQSKADSLIKQARQDTQEARTAPTGSLQRDTLLQSGLRNYLRGLRAFESTKGEGRAPTYVYEELAELYESVGLFQEAIDYLRRAEGSTSSSTKKAAIYDHMAYLHQRAGNSTMARKYYNEALEQRDKTQPTVKSRLYDRLGDTYLEDFQRSKSQSALNEAFNYKKLALEEINKTTNSAGKAIAQNNLSVVHRKRANLQSDQGDLKASLGELNRSYNLVDSAYRLLPSDPIRESKIVTLINRAIVFQNLGRYRAARQDLNEVLSLRKKEKNPLEIARTYNLLAKLEYYHKKYDEAAKYAKQSLRYSEDEKNNKEAPYREESQISYGILADIYGVLKDYQKVSEYTQKYYAIENDLIRSETTQQLKGSDFIKIEAEQDRKDREKAEAERAITEAEAEKREAELALQNAKTEAERKEAELALAKAKSREAELARQKAEAEAERQKAELDREKAEAERQRAELAREKAEAETEARKREEKLAKEKADAEAKRRQEKRAREKAEADAERQRTTNRYIGALLFFALIFAFTLFYLHRTRRKNRLLSAQNKKIRLQSEEIAQRRDELIEINEEVSQQKEEIASQRDAIEIEKQKTDLLLLNILPKETARELKDRGVATPRSYQLVSVLFTDFKGFTNIASELSPEEVVKELDACFQAFDEIIEKHGLEKIKTIGDAYMCAGGIPTPNQTNPFDAVQAGIEIQDFMNQLKAEKEARGEPTWQVRLGINTGPCVAGVIGKKKFAYDIWGDTVNVASRMESSGEVGKVNISGDTYELIKDHYECQYRGKIPAKNKGDVDMYFVKGLRK